MNPSRKPLEFWADALDVLRDCPDEVRRRVGFALDEAQLGQKAGSAKPINNVGRGVYAITTNHDSETYRTFYVARFAEAVYCFYVVHKKATKGIDLPKRQKDLAAARYREIVDWRESEGLV
ncbi:type II toxin-antitoxin system RelE/ParE family toxin [Rubrivirga sp.]|uniref:type II toxin-antitoxin system RelE/ParE family toxin n=1 Tax=Rubrivirga sp. TaxID=1885344 RepID=UPI003B52E73C